MAGGVSPLVEFNWANLETGTAPCADIPVNSHVGSPYAEFLRWFHRTPDGYAFLFPDFLPVLLEIRIYRQNDPPMRLIHKLL
jgi:hypothetical protein